MQYLECMPDVEEDVGSLLFLMQFLLQSRDMIENKRSFIIEKER